MDKQENPGAFGDGPGARFLIDLMFKPLLFLVAIAALFMGTSDPLLKLLGWEKKEPSDKPEEKEAEVK